MLTGYLSVPTKDKTVISGYAFSIFPFFGDFILQSSNYTDIIHVINNIYIISNIVDMITLNHSFNTDLHP